MPGHDLIVVGTSLGGVTALRDLASGLSPDLPAAVLAVIHLHPGTRTVLDQVLGRASRIPVRFATNMEPIQPGTLVIAPPDRHMLVGEGHIRVLRGPKENGHRPAIDPLFRTAAHVYGARAIGVVMTGALDCGARGLETLKRRGGIAVVQDPSDAECPDMPRAAMAAVTPDHICSLADLPALLDRLAREPAPETVEVDLGLGGGTASGLTCPACSGALWEAGDGPLKHFSCRTGHIYSMDTLIPEQSEALERALWAAIRSLEESASIARRAAVERRVAGDTRAVDELESRARHAEEESALVRQVLERLGDA